MTQGVSSDFFFFSFYLCVCVCILFFLCLLLFIPSGFRDHPPNLIAFSISSLLLVSSWVSSGWWNTDVLLGIKGIMFRLLEAKVNSTEVCEFHSHVRYIVLGLFGFFVIIRRSKNMKIKRHCFYSMMFSMPCLVLVVFSLPKSKKSICCFQPPHFAPTCEWQRQKKIIFCTKSSSSHWTNPNKSAAASEIFTLESQISTWSFFFHHKYN